MLTAANESPWKYVITWLRVVFGVHLLYSGVAYIIGGWTPLGMDVQASPALKFMDDLNTVGFYPYIKYLEAIVGIMLILNIATPLALVLEFPITVTIFFLNVFIEGYGRHLFTGTQEMFLNASLLLAYGGYYVSFLAVRSRPSWLWDGPVITSSTPADNTTSSSRSIVLAIIITVALSVMVLLASKLLSEATRQLPPRDWLPLLCGFVMIAFVYFKDKSK